jgi:beta-lactamase regulating signal transducer with metallopeptidase domain
MILPVLAEAALRSVLLGCVVWASLNLFRVRNPHLQMISWILVLVASLAMPLLMRWTMVTITVDSLSMVIPDNPWPTESAWPEPVPSVTGAPAAVRSQPHVAISWLDLATAVYAGVAGLLLLRLAVGICFAWRLVRAATPVVESWAAGQRVRVSKAVGGPVTVGSTILLPPHHVDWDLRKRQAVLAHEAAHVANGDFYVLLLASLNRAVFWFSPFAWWQLIRLAELAEFISDASAIEAVADRLSYAEILIDLLQHGRRVPAGLEMARAGTVRLRVERILAATTLPALVGWRQRLLFAVAILPVVLVSAGSITYGTRLSVPVADRAAEEGGTAGQPHLVAFYALGRTSIFAIFRQGDDLSGQLSGQRKERMSAGSDGTYSYPTAEGQVTFALGDEPLPPELTVRQNGRDLRAARIADTSRPRVGVDSGALESYVGWYELSPHRVLHVTGDGTRIHVQETGRPQFEVMARGADAFSSNHDELLIFLRDAQSGAMQLLFQDPISGARLAPRVASARATMIQDEFARRIAEAPDRFRAQVPLPGSKEMVLRGISDMQRGVPNYERMSTALAVKIRRQVSDLQSMFQLLGAVETIFFRGVGPGGYDIYGVKFANGLAEIRLLMGADGKAEDVIFRPDGNDAPGSVLGCSDEQGLQSKGDTSPIQMVFYNDTGRELRLYRVGADGQRVHHGVMGDSMSSVILSNVDTPWIVADSSGRCLEIVLPGQQTRYHTFSAGLGGAPAERAGRPRSVPQAGSEEMLRQYIEALGRGQPNYERMTSEVAAQTQQQLPFNQAIVARLGALRALSFRGVTSLGNDIYMAHFANGSAEWRIGLVKDGTIGRIALGPQ